MCEIAHELAFVPVYLQCECVGVSEYVNASIVRASVPVSDSVCKCECECAWL